MRPLLFACLLLFFGAALADDIDERRDELESIKSEIEKNRREIQKLSGKEADLSHKLSKLDDNISLINGYLKKLSDQENALKGDIDSTQSDLTRTTGNLSWRKDMLKKRIRSIYMRGRYDALDLVFGAGDFSDFLRRQTFYKLLADHDRRLIAGIFREQRVIKNSKTRLERRLNDVQDVKTEKAREQDNLERQKKDREKLLLQVKGKKAGYLKMVSDLERRSTEINRLIATLEEARRKLREARKPDRLLVDYGDFGKFKGRLPWPVEGKIVRKYGTNIHPVYKTKTINNGVDIGVEPGTQVLSVAAGEVLYSGTLSSFGNFIILGHGNGFYTLYANLSRVSVKKGESVAAGRAIAHAGDEGSLEGAKLHFELRRERQIFNPQEWLSKR